VSNPVWIDKFEALEINLFSLRPGNIVVAIFFALIFSYMLSALRFVGLAAATSMATLTYVTTIFFIGYLFVIVDYTAQGYQEIPKLSGNLLTTERSRLLKELVLIAFFVSLFFVFDNPYWKLFFIISSLVLFPVSTAVIIMEESLVSAVNPVKWVGIVMDLDADAVFVQYLLIQGLTLFAGYVALFVDLGFFNLITMTILVMLLLTLFRSLGVLLHSNAETLGIPVRFGMQIEDEQLKAEQERGYSEFSSELYKLSSGGNLKEAWDLLDERLKKDKYATEADFFARLRNYDNPVLAVKTGQGYTERLVLKGDFRTAWNVLEFCYVANNKKYRLTSSNVILQLMTQAETGLQKAIVVSLLSHFEEDFPEHPRRSEALLVAARITAEDLDDFERARKMMQHLLTTYPNIYSDKDYQALKIVLAGDQPPSSHT
jgi:hypothetical protein